MSGGTLAAAGNNPLNKRILSAPADSELCLYAANICGIQKGPDSEVVRAGFRSKVA